MGVIARQGVKQSVVNYTATAIAAVSTLFIYPLEENLYGVWLTLFGLASLLQPFASFGVHTITIRYFPQFRDPDSDHSGFLSFLLILSTAVFGVFAALLWSIKGSLISGLELLNFDSSFVSTYLGLILVFTYFLILQNLLTNYTSNFRRIVIPAILNNIWPKIVLPIVILLGWQGFLNADQFLLALLIMQIVAVIGHVIYLWSIGELRLKVNSAVLGKEHLKGMFVFGIYGALGSVGSIFAFKIDHVMISFLIGMGGTGVYGIAQFIGTSIAMPARSLYAIASPVIADAWKDGNTDEIRMIYKKSSLNLLIVGLPILAIIILTTDSLFQLTSKYELLKTGQIVVFLMAFGKLIDMAFGVNGQIIGYSERFRFNLYAILLMAVVNIILNYYLIPKMGIAGAAWASFIAITVYNIIRAIFVYSAFNMQPFTIETLKVLGLGVLAFGVAWIIPMTGIPLLDILLKSAAVAVTFVPLVIRLGISQDFNQLVDKTIMRIRSRF